MIVDDIYLLDNLTSDFPYACVYLHINFTDPSNLIVWKPFKSGLLHPVICIS